MNWRNLCSGHASLALHCTSLDCTVLHCSDSGAIHSILTCTATCSIVLFINVLQCTYNAIMYHNIFNKYALHCKV